MSLFAFFPAQGAWHCGDRPLEGSFSLQTTRPATAAGKTVPNLNREGFAGIDLHGRCSGGRQRPSLRLAVSLGLVELCECFRAHLWM